MKPVFQAEVNWNVNENSKFGRIVHGVFKEHPVFLRRFESAVQLARDICLHFARHWRRTPGFTRAEKF